MEKVGDEGIETVVLWGEETKLGQRATIESVCRELGRPGLCAIGAIVGFELEVGAMARVAVEMFAQLVGPTD